MIYADISSPAAIQAARFATHAARTRQLILEHDTAELERCIALKWGLGRKAWAIDLAALSGLACAVLSVVVCVAQIGGVL